MAQKKLYPLSHGPIKFDCDDVSHNHSCPPDKPQYQVDDAWSLVYRNTIISLPTPRLLAYNSNKIVDKIQAMLKQIKHCCPSKQWKESLWNVCCFRSQINFTKIVVIIKPSQTKISKLLLTTVLIMTYTRGTLWTINTNP